MLVAVRAQWYHRAVSVPRRPSDTDSLVSAVWSQRCERDAPPYLLPPDTGITFVFSFADGTEARGGYEPVCSLGEHYCTGLRTRPVTLHPRGAVDYFAVTLRPHALRSLLGIHAREVSDAFVDLSHLCRGLCDAMEPCATSGASEASRVRALDNYLRHRMSGGVLEPPRYLLRALDCISAAHGNVRIARLGDTIGATTRQLEREFDRWVGVSAKFYARITRMNRALRILEFDGTTSSLAEVVESLGYYDQAHLCGEFVELVGMRPSEVAGV